MKERSARVPTATTTISPAAYFNGGTEDSAGFGPGFPPSDPESGFRKALRSR